MGVEDRQNLILAGFMGTGKSTVGHIVAARLQRPLLDTDAAIEAGAGKSIAALFAGDGEGHFRRLEAALCRQLAQQDGQVIAVGGGALLDEASRRALETGGIIICLRANLDAIMQRVGDDPARPLFDSREEVARLLSSRQAHYDSFEHQVNTTGKTPDQVAEEVIILWQQVS